MTLKSDSLLKDVLAIESDDLNIIKPEIIKYLGRNVRKTKIRNTVITVSLVLVFASLVYGGFDRVGKGIVNTTVEVTQ